MQDKFQSKRGLFHACITFFSVMCGKDEVNQLS